MERRRDARGGDRERARCGVNRVSAYPGSSGALRCNQRRTREVRPVAPGVARERGHALHRGVAPIRKSGRIIVRAPPDALFKDLGN